MDGSAIKRNHAFDVLRVVALSAVIMIHVSSRLFNSFDAEAFFVGNIFNSLSRFAVPVFAMVTGALLLNEEKKLSCKKLLSEYILKTVLLFLFWSVLYAVLFSVLVPLKNGNAPDISKVFTSIFKGHYHMWYLHMLIGFYLVLPLYRRFVIKANKSIVAVMIAVLTVVQSLIPIADLLLKEHSGFELMHIYENSGLRTFFGFHLFFLYGWYVRSFRLSAKARYAIYILGAASLVFTIVATAFISMSENKAYTDLYNSLYLNNVCFSFAVFLFFLQKYKNKESIAKPVTDISRLSFGIYIIHPIIVELFCEKSFMPSSPVLYVITLWLMAAVLSYLICLAVSKVPFLKKIIRT